MSKRHGHITLHGPAVRRRLIGPAAWCGIVAAAALGIVVSCAYYNIFWMAQEEYEKAISKTAIADFWDPYAQPKPSGETLKTIDSCAKRCGKILLLYPKSKWVDDALILMGNCFLIKGEYANAIRKYDEVINLYASSEFAEEARYMKAYTHVVEGSPEEALILLGTQAGEDRRSRWQERVIFLQGRVYEKMGDCENAATHMETYLERFPNGLKSTEVTLSLGECLIRLGRQNEALTVLGPLASREDLAGTMASLRLGRAYRELGQADKSLEIFQRLSEGTAADSLKARALVERGVTLDKEGRYDEAVGALTLADSLGKNTLLGEAQYRMGLVSEKGLGDLAKAAAAYSEASKVQSTFGKLASKRGAALKAKAKYEESLADTTTKTVDTEAATRFMLAETYLLDLGLTARALEQYEILSDSMATNSYTARAMLAAGSLLEAKGDSVAGRYYQAVIDSFPTTVYANVARSRLGLPLADIVVATPDTVQADTSGRIEMEPPAPEGGAVVPDTTVSHGQPASPAPEESLGVGRPLESDRDTSIPWPPQRPWERGSPDTMGTPIDTTGTPRDTSGAPQDTTQFPGSDWGEQ